jgi:hypothetical protein
LVKLLDREIDRCAEGAQYDAAEQRGGDQLRARGQADELDSATGTDDDFARCEPPANRIANPGLQIFHLCYTPQQDEALDKTHSDSLGFTHPGSGKQHTGRLCSWPP